MIYEENVQEATNLQNQHVLKLTHQRIDYMKLSHALHCHV